MTARRALALAALAALLGAAPVPAAAPLDRFPATAVTSQAGLRVVTQDVGDAALTGVAVFVAAGLERQTRATNGAAALTAECVIRTPVAASGGGQLPLRDAIEALGGSITYSVDDATVHYYVESAPARMPQLLGLLAKALAAPDFSSATVAAARTQLTQRVTESEKNPLRVGVQMVKESYLEAGLAYPDYGTASSLAALGPTALRGFYARTYRRGGVTASIVGKVTPDVTAAIGALAQALPAGSPDPLSAKARPIPEQGTRIIAQRDMGRPFVVVGFGAPSPGTADFGAMLIVEALLSDSFERSSATTLSLGERSVGALYLFDETPASLIVYVNGGTGVDPSSAIREVLLAAKTLAGKPLAADALARFKATAAGAFVTNATTLSDRAYLIGTLAAGGLADRSANGALDAIEHTTSADVQRAAKAYLQRYIVALVLPRSTQQSN
jgi:predicted Zn-dependent peptidase